MTKLKIDIRNGLVEVENDKDLAATVYADFKDVWPTPGSEDTELGVFMGSEVGHGEAEVHARVQA